MQHLAKVPYPIGYRGFESPPLRQLVSREGHKVRRSIDDWRRSGACVLWTWMLFAACAGPRLAIGRPPDAGACHLDGRVLTAGAVPLPYYGTAVLDAFPAPGDGGPREFERLPARVAVPMPEPTSPWLFPLDLPLEALARLRPGRSRRHGGADRQPGAGGGAGAGGAATAARGRTTAGPGALGQGAAMIPAPGARVLVLGLGRFGGGQQAARFLHGRGCALRIADQSAGPDLDAGRSALADLHGIDWQLGRQDEALLDQVDCVVVNPAVPDAHPLLQAARARGIACTQEVNLFLEAYPGRVVAVTGTNGKSTTAMLMHACLDRADMPALLGGNIGRSLLADQDRWRADQTAVLEISSFQLERIDLGRHRVHGAVLTRMGKDHLDRHGTLQAYHAAKARLPAIAHGFVVHAADDAVAAAFATPAPRRITYAQAPPGADRAGVEGDWLLAPRPGGSPARLLHASALQLLGGFQRENAMAAAAAALQLGAAPHPVALALATARPLPFRLQLCCVLDGVRVYDNGVSTEIESTRSAFAALPGTVHWVGGGKSKDGDFRTVADGVLPGAASAHLFGAAAEPLAACLQGRIPVTRSVRLLDALDAALAAARPGEALLFSPAFASFDQYPNFRVRAQEFHRWLADRRAAKALAARAGTDQTGGAVADR
jgi:UDP-N-acetylmuramoylalanine--D-glutamate ligase